MIVLRELSDAQLKARLLKLGRIRSAVLIGLVLCLAEVHRRRIHLAAGFGSLAEYCRDVLREDRRKAWRLALAAEAVADFALARELLESQQISVSALVAIKKALTRDNHRELLTAAIGMTEEEAIALSSLYLPRPRRTDSIRVVHSLEPTFVGSPSETPNPSNVELMPVERFEMLVTMTKDVHKQLEHVRSALSHQIPDGNLNDILGECFRITLEAVARRKVGANTPYVVDPVCPPTPLDEAPKIAASPSLSGAHVGSSMTTPVISPPSLSAGADSSTRTAVIRRPSLSGADAGSSLATGVVRPPSLSGFDAGCRLTTAVVRPPSLSGSDAGFSLTTGVIRPPSLSGADTGCSLTTGAVRPPSLSGNADASRTTLAGIRQSGPGVFSAGEIEEALGDATTATSRRSFEVVVAEWALAADRSRYISAEVRRAVWLRDRGCCSFIGEDGRRCGSRHQLEFDHWLAFSLGGEHTVDNVRVLCAAHNRYEAERVLGAELMQKFFDRPRAWKRGARDESERNVDCAVVSHDDRHV